MQLFTFFILAKKRIQTTEGKIELKVYLVAIAFVAWVNNWGRCIAEFLSS